MTIARRRRNSRLNDHRTAPPQVHAEWIDTRPELDAWLSQVDGPLAVDTEFMRRNTYYAQLALVQLSHRERHALVDPLAVEVGQALSQLDAERAPLWIMHSPGEDLDVLSPWLENGPRQLFDTQLAAAFCGLGAGISYRALVEHVAGVVLDKGETRSDWMQRPLTASQRLYATLDVTYLHPIHAHLYAELERRGRSDWFSFDCTRLKQRATDRRGDDQPQLNLRGAASWPIERQAMLRRVLQWRERTARTLDSPRPWLLQDAQAMALVDDPPENVNQLAAQTRGQRTLRGPQRRELLDLLQEPIHNEEIVATTPVPPSLDRTERPILAAMKQEIDAQANSLDLPAGLLAPRKALETYIVTRTWPETLEGWRRDLLEPHLAPHLPET